MGRGSGGVGDRLGGWGEGRLGGIGDGGRGGGEVMGEEVALEDGEGGFGGVGEVEEVEVTGGDDAVGGHGIEVEDAPPEGGAIEDDGDLFAEFAGLGEGEHFKGFVERAKAAREDDEGFGEGGEPKLAHEEVMEVEGELGGDERVGTLLEGEGDVKADGFGAGLPRAAVGGFHNAGAAAGGDDEAMAGAGEGVSPGGVKAGEGAGVLVEAGHIEGGSGGIESGSVSCRSGESRPFCFACGFGRDDSLRGGGVKEGFEGGGGGFAGVDAGGAEEDDGVFDALGAEAGHGFGVLGEDAEGAAFGGVEKSSVFVGEGGLVEGWRVRGVHGVSRGLDARNDN